MELLVIGSVALLASGLTFFTGFGLGTLLLPAFAAFFPVEAAVALTAVVHLANSLFKLALVGRYANAGVVLRFGLPALLAALAGAGVLAWTSRLEPLVRYRLGGRDLDVTPVELAIAMLMAAFALLEIWPRFRKLRFEPRHLPIGGLVAGFFGGLSGHQGALRSAFLVRVGLEKREFIATGVVLAAIVDLARLAVYAGSFAEARFEENSTLLLAAAGAAFAGAVLGSRLLDKVALRAIEVAVAALLLAVAILIGTGLL